MAPQRLESEAQRRAVDKFRDAPFLCAQWVRELDYKGEPIATTMVEEAVFYKSPPQSRLPNSPTRARFALDSKREFAPR